MKVKTKRKKVAGAGHLAKTGINRVKAMPVDFGTYHHSTPEESKELRDRAEKSFSKLLRPMYSSRRPLRILDAGCGLGFLTYVAAKCFPKAQVTGVDLFQHGSLVGMSLEKAANNMKSLGMGARTSFFRHDLTKVLPSEPKYDLVVSNLVFHNMGKKRFQGYGTIFEVLNSGGYFVIGDVFPDDKSDLDCFREHSTLLKELNEGGSGRWVYKIRVLRKR